MQLAIAPYRIVDHGPHLCYDPPAGAVAAIDWRPIAEQANGSYVPTLGCLAVFNDGVRLPDGSIDIGDLDGAATARSRSAVASFTGSTPQGDTNLRLILDTMTRLADPTGDNHVRPFMPYRNRLGFKIAGRRMYESFRFGSHPHTGAVQAVVKRDLSRLRGDSLRGETRGADGQIDTQHHRKTMTAYMEVYKAPFESLRPNDWDIGETPRPKETEYIDDFERASIGSGWVDVSGSHIIVSSAYGATKTSLSQARYDTALADAIQHYAYEDQFPNGTAGNYQRQGPAGLMHASAATMYYTEMRHDNGSFYMLKRVTGSYTTLDSVGGNTTGSGYIYITIVGGTSQDAYWSLGSTYTLSATDTAITGNLYGGMHGSGTTSKWTDVDNWLIQDSLGAGGSVPVFMHHYKMMNGSN